MRVFLVACLLIGSVSGVPVWKESGSNPADTNYGPLPLPGGWVSSDPGSSSAQPTLLSQGSVNAPQAPAPQAPAPAPQDVVYSAGPSSSNYPSVYSNYPGVGAGSYSGVSYAAPAPVGYDSAPSGGYGGYYSSPSAGAGSYRFGSAPRDESWSSGSATNYGVSQDTQEPVFSDVSALEPVYSFGSRSSYQRGRAVFAQSHYTPGEPVFEPVPQYDPVVKTPPKQTPSVW